MDEFFEEVFNKNDIYYGFYERFFNDESIRSLTGYLGIPFQPGNYGKIINEGQRDTKYKKIGYEKIIANHYRDTYLFLYEKFGKDFIKNIWNSAVNID